MAKTLRDIPTFTKRFWKGVGDEVADRIRVHTTKGGKDVDGVKFKPYSTGYAERKPKLFRGGTNFGSKVNLTLSGDMMNNLQTRGFTKDSVIVGWSGTNAQKIQWNADMGREVTKPSMPVTKGIQRFILKQVDRFIEKNAREATKKPINLKIGK